MSRADPGDRGPACGSRRKQLGPAVGGVVAVFGQIAIDQDVCDPLWAGLPGTIEATRYHSLAIAPETLPACLKASAVAAAPDDPQLIMALRHRDRPLFGVQFHPESIGTPHGPALLQNFVALCK